MSQERIRIGIAGLGRSGWNIHGLIMGELADLYNVVAVADADAERREEANAKFGCGMYETYDEFLCNEQIELVVVALPSFLHADATIAALETGKHVVCEKPMAASLADSDRMIAAAHRSDGILSIFQNRRYAPDYLTVRRVIDSGLLGRIVQINMTGSGFSRRWDWQTLKQFGGGSLNNTAVHYLDQAVQLFGGGQPDV
ncbi:MAG: Gfo/Idh/MocA family oxidoreductase, partial [Anaerolineae bacterium]|nr:Gfo/Idh/MocA family oxidoreductase [Anaerolineae bacterium]